MLRTRQKLGKYRIERRIADGGFASVYQAMDTIEGIRVALKVPHQHLLTEEMLADFRSEVRLMAQLEQAMGKPSFRSDVFSLGLIMYRMFSGRWPEWPYRWPLPGSDRLRKAVHPDLTRMIRKAIDVDPRKRFKDAEQMRAVFRRILPQAAKARTSTTSKRNSDTARRSWHLIRHHQFQTEHGKALETRYACHRCQGPISEPMQVCPWCGTRHAVFREETRFPVQCPRCRRGMKSDWAYCPWCYGPGFELTTTRQYSDVRYNARCSNPGCSRKLLMPFMRYCPWCHRKVQKKWKVPGTNEACSACGMGVTRSYWEYCPWCGKTIRKT